jgi:hypothetical protein
VKSLTYVYCLVLSGRRPGVSRRLTAIGVPGAQGTRAIAAGRGLWLIAASVPADEYDEAALAAGLQNLDWVSRRAMAHEAVVEQFLTARAVLPMQLFTLFTSDDRALGHVERQRTEIVSVVRRLERKLEWGLRLTFDEQAVRDAVTAGHAPAPAGSSKNGSRRADAPRQRRGTAYLTQKRDLLDVRRVQLEAARSEADRLFTVLERDAADARRRTSTEQAAPGSRLLLDAAFLVPTSRTRTFRAAVKRKTKELGSAGVIVSLTGPWPPYNFISPSAVPRRTATARGLGSRRGQAAH